MTPDIPFESTEQTYRNSDYLHFRVGTCHGLWRATDHSYEILAVHNRAKGNGHFKAALWWFEQSCRRDGKTLLLRQVFNPWLAFQCWRHGYQWHWLMNFEKSFS